MLDFLGIFQIGQRFITRPNRSVCLFQYPIAFAFDTRPAQADRVQAVMLRRCTGNHRVRQYIFPYRNKSGDHGIATDATELVHGHAASDHRVITDLDMTANRRVDRHYDTVTDRAVMGDMRVDHQVAVRAQAGGCRRHGCTVDGGAFPESVGITDFDPGFRGWIKRNILRQVADDDVRMDPVVSAHAYIIMDHRVRANPGICTDFDMIVDDRIGPYHGTFGEYCIRRDNRGGVFFLLGHSILKADGRAIVNHRVHSGKFQLAEWKNHLELKELSDAHLVIILVESLYVPDLHEVDMSDIQFNNQLTDQINVSPEAARQLLALTENEEGVNGVRIFVSGGGCGGMSYGMTFVDQPNEYDCVLEQDGIKVFVDAVALSYLEGVEVDYQTQGANASFVFKNVFANTGGSGTCGACGAAGGGCG